MGLSRTQWYVVITTSVFGSIILYLSSGKRDLLSVSAF